MVRIGDIAAWYGDGQSSGLLALGYLLIDSAHDNQNISDYDFLADLNYDPFPPHYKHFRKFFCY